jgi:amino acid permease
MMVFPTYTSLKEKTQDNFYTVINWYSFVSVAYLAFIGITQVCSFGAETKTDVLLNFGEFGGFSSYLVRCMFAVVLFTHIPYVFFPAKESGLVFVDEINRKSISSQLAARINTSADRQED